MTEKVDHKGVDDAMLSRAMDGVLPNGHRVWAYVGCSNPDPEVTGREVMRVALAAARAWDGDLFERAYAKGYRAALGAAAAECRRLAEATDHGGNTYVRYGEAARCAAVVSGLRVPAIQTEAIAPHQPDALIAKWREAAKYLRTYSDAAMIARATGFEDCADELAALSRLEPHP